ncbi:putative mitochondrial protein [Cucumis melo var. makuwa]|uniref:Mitochondrial protein n=1 Tax=Cucumis melo var. makuwa TaxID=1194695 RepID=A0A5D3C7P3_CUCMM|nr:putative mitochondrial protein [Cucumis melo var. makuwa]TYK07987.1 putative mitochondrial protein [Cucumis melo var. makuwa]
MVIEGIVPGHKISNAGLEVDLMKIDVVSKLPKPSNVKPLWSFLRHARFYRRFVKGFSQITKLLSNLLSINQPYIFDEKCHQAFQTLKDVLTLLPILIIPDRLQPFKLMCDVSDVAVGAMLVFPSNMPFQQEKKDIVHYFPDEQIYRWDESFLYKLG